jgi:hypothetical protein
MPYTGASQEADRTAGDALRRRIVGEADDSMVAQRPARGGKESSCDCHMNGENWILMFIGCLKLRQMA